MRLLTTLAGAAIAVSLAGCYTYPVYQPAPIARMTPEQSQALAYNQQMSQQDRDRVARDNAVVAQQDANPYAYSAPAPVAPSYYAPAPYYYDAYPYYYYGYPYYGYGGFYPGLALSFGFRGGFRGGRFGGFHGGGGFHGHR